MGKSGRELPRRCRARPEGRRRAVQSRVREEEAGGPEEATAQAGPETEPESGQARPAETGSKEGPKATIRLDKATTDGGLQAGFQTAGPIPAAAGPAGKRRPSKAEGPGPGQAGQAAKQRPRRRKTGRTTGGDGRAPGRADDRSRSATVARCAKGRGAGDDFRAPTNTQGAQARVQGLVNVNFRFSIFDFRLSRAQDSRRRGKTVAQARLLAAHFPPSPGPSPLPSDGRGVRGEGNGEREEGRGEGGRHVSTHFHELSTPRRGVKSPEARRNGRHVALLAALLLVVGSTTDSVLAATLTAALDRDTIGAGESATLSLKV